jgi:hypothetical protein
LRSGLSIGRQTAATTYWNIWSNFRLQHNLEPYITQGSDAIYWLQIFAVRVRNGWLSASNNPVRADMVADALTHIGTAHTMANQRDPRLVPGSTALHPRLTCILNGFQKEDSAPSRKEDSAPSRVLPIPVQVLQRAAAIALLQNTALSLSAADLIWLAFFFLLRPGEYTITGKSPHPFTLADVRLWHHDTPIDPLMALPDSLILATFVILIFTDQKNAVRSETVGHGRSGDPQACPVLAVVCRILHLCSFDAPPNTQLCTLNATGSSIPAKSITALCHQGGLAFSVCNNVTLPILHQKAIRATGASALLAQGANYKTIKLLGRWKSNAAMRYLHLQSRMSALAPSMLNALR